MPNRRRSRDLADADARDAAGESGSADRGASRPQPRTGRAPRAAAAFAIGHRARRREVNEDLALGLPFRALALMRSRGNMRAASEGIEAMKREEAAYWLGMALHRRNPRLMLTALRCLLTGPRRRRT